MEFAILFLNLTIDNILEASTCVKRFGRALEQVHAGG